MFSVELQIKSIQHSRTWTIRSSWWEWKNRGWTALSQLINPLKLQWFSHFSPIETFFNWRMTKTVISKERRWKSNQKCQLIISWNCSKEFRPEFFVKFHITIRCLNDANALRRVRQLWELWNKKKSHFRTDVRSLKRMYDMQMNKFFCFWNIENYILYDSVDKRLTRKICLIFICRCGFDCMSMWKYENVIFWHFGDEILRYANKFHQVSMC